MTAGRIDYWRLKLHALGCLLVGIDMLGVASHRQIVIGILRVDHYRLVAIGLLVIIRIAVSIRVAVGV